MPDLKPIFETCTPRPEVLSGELTDDLFAARLRDVVEGEANPIYGDAARFFEHTFQTEGLRLLAREVCGRLSGAEPTNNAIIRLETSFGGGKTHNLIALHHLASGRAKGVHQDLVDDAWLPEEREWLTASVTGAELDPANGIRRGDIITRTLWGEIAVQLGRQLGRMDEAFDLVRVSEESLVAPGTQWLSELVGDRPTLIMIDEVARHLRAAKAVATANGQSDVAAQTAAFLMSLFEFAASQPHVTVVLTLAESVDAFAAETEELLTELAESEALSARGERVITPAADMEIPRIVTHRLFEQVDRGAAEKTGRAFHAFLAEIDRQGVDLPNRVRPSAWADEFADTYPFHPELLNTLSRKTATIPVFQRTRGALRLLARVVRKLWETRPEDVWAIGVHHLDLSDEGTVNDLTSRLGRPRFREVVTADLANLSLASEAHATAIDRKWIEAGKPPFALRTGTCILLHSLSEGTAKGAEKHDLVISVLEPGDDPALLDRSLRIALAEEKADAGTAFWYLHFDGHRYLFKTEPSLEKIVLDEVQHVRRTVAREELERRIRKIWGSGHLRPVFFPAEPGDLPDDAESPKLVLMHYDSVQVTAEAQEPPDLVRRLYERSGQGGAYRTYKNNVLFLVADEAHRDRMLDVMLRYLAIERVSGDSDRVRSFEEPQRQRLREMRDAAELEVRVAITRAYRHLYYPSQDAPAEAGGLARETLPAQDQGDIRRDQSAVIVEALRQLGKVSTANDPPMAARFVRSKAWPVGQDSLTTDDLKREFAKRIGLRILLDVNQLKRTIQDGCRVGEWIYYDADEKVGYGRAAPAPSVRFAPETVLYTPEEADRLSIPLKGETDEPEPETCPLCRKDPCVCGTDDGDPAGGPQPASVHEVEGAPGEVLEKVRDFALDQGWTGIHRLHVEASGEGTEAVEATRSLGLAVPQLGKGKFGVYHRLVAEFQRDGVRDDLTIEFQGSWARYKQLKNVSEAMGQQADRVNVSTRLTLVFPGDLQIDSDQFRTLQEVFTTLPLGRVRIRAEAPAVAAVPGEPDQERSE